MSEYLLGENTETRGGALTAHSWQKWKSTFLTCPCHEIYREEAVGVKNSNYTKKYDFCEYVKFGAFRENVTFCP